ncbi:regulatory protein RecX [Faecalimicrobium dakarense]|uniref:regulatory protein RecX n=1 Tax=Faecalimicrobium dakarense TaxID=1301100 RepID=UPI00356B67CD
MNLNRCGRNKIKQNLYNKGIDKQSINEAINEIDEDAEYENAMYLAQKRYDRIKNEDKRKIYQKISQHLAYKGFNYDIIKRVLNKLLNTDEYDF